MAVFPKASDAKERAQGNKLIAQVINRIEEKVLEVGRRMSLSGSV